MTALRTRVLAAVVVTFLATTSVAGAVTAAPAVEPTGGEATAPTPEASAAPPTGNNTTLVTDGEELVFEPAPNQTVRGETALEPGTEVSIALEGPTSYQSDTTAVTDEGTFEASFDLSTAPPGATMGVSVTADSPNGTETTLVTTTARIECTEDCASGTTDSDGGETALEADAVGVESIVEVTQGRVASVDVSFGAADALTVSVGGPSVNYVVNGTIRDQDGDGRATVLFYTDEAGTDAPTLSVIDAGERRVVEADAETSLDSPLAPGSYDVTLYPGSSATGDAAAEGRVVVFDSAGPESPAASANTSIVTDGEELVFEPAPNQTVRGETAQAPGTNLSLDIEGETFLATSVVTVAEDGTFDATVDLSDAAGEHVEIRVYHDGELLAETDGEVSCADCETVETTGTVTELPVTTALDSTESDGLLGRVTGGVGMVALGGVLAVAGIGVLLGLFRS